MNKRLFGLHSVATWLVVFVMTLPGIHTASGSDVDAVSELEPDFQNGVFVYQLCADCHTPEGWGNADGSVPVLSGQHRRVLIKQLEDIRDGHRGNDAMFPFAQDDAIGGAQSIADVTAYISRLLMPSAPGKGPGTHLEEGRRLYIERCAVCHGAAGEGDNARLYPRIGGQHYKYLLRQMDHIADGTRGNSDPAMVLIIRFMSPSEKASISDFLSRTLPEKELVAPPYWENPDFNYGFQ